MKMKTPAKTIDKRSEVRGAERREAHSVAMKLYWKKRKAAEKRAANKLVKERKLALERAQASAMNKRVANFATAGIREDLAAVIGKPKSKEKPFKKLAKRAA